MVRSELRLEKIGESNEGENVIFVGPRDKVMQLCAVHLRTTVCYGLMPHEVNLTKVLELSEQFNDLVIKEKLNRLTLVGVGWGGAVVINYAANNIKNIRRILFVDAFSRPEQMFLEKVIEWIEDFLPLGLPFRPISKHFDPRPILHRVRCPVLVLTDKQSQITESQLIIHARFLMSKLPNAWRKEFIYSEFAKIFDSFLKVSTKQPQKVLRAG